MNFLEETKKAITQSRHTEHDIIYIGSSISEHQCTWDEFCKLSDFEYDAGYGAPEIPIDLIIVFNNNEQMVRREYDGSEWWEFQNNFAMPKNKLPITTLKGSFWHKLSDINE